MLEFKTFKSMLIVASVIPLGVVGGIFALLATGYTLSFTAMIGFVALIGIEIKTSILLVDFTNQLRQDGVPLDEAIGTVTGSLTVNYQTRSLSGYSGDLVILKPRTLLSGVIDWKALMKRCRRCASSRPALDPISSTASA